MALDNPSYFSMANPPPLSSLSSSLSSTSSSSSTRRSLRSLLRSLSSNSADSSSLTASTSAAITHEFNTGAPRLSDIAPEFKHPLEPRRANSLKAHAKSKSKSMSMTADGCWGTHHRLCSPLPMYESPHPHGGDGDDAMVVAATKTDEPHDEEDEVFLTHDASVRYYNVKPRRRHSISTLCTSTTAAVDHHHQQQQQQQQAPIVHHRQRSASDLQEATPGLARINSHIDDHKLRHGSYPRKRCIRCPRGVITKRSDMEDILILSAKGSEPASLWTQYFASYFEQISQNANRKPYRIRHLGVEEIVAANGDVQLIAERTATVKLQLVVVCPIFLEKIDEHPAAASAGLTKLLHSDRILALQLGTSDADVHEAHKQALPSFTQWQRRAVGQDQDEHFALEFVSTAIGIFTKIWKQQSSAASEENSQFSLTPKKIRHGHTSVLILLEYPLQHEDIVKISIVKNEEMTEVKSIKRRNPYTLKFSIPESFLEVSAIVDILVEKNGSFIGRRPIKCESRLRELEQILRSTNAPVEFMCQSLGFSPQDIEQLDNWLVHMFQQNVPPNFNLFVGDNETPGTGKHVCELFPTLLHFSARYGLEKLTAQLLDCPGGELACEIRNVQDFTPADIAENAGHKEINSMLRGYMKMNELATVYTKIKKLTADELPLEKLIFTSKRAEKKEENVEDDVPYLIPKQPEMEEFYKMCPAPKPIKSASAPCTPMHEHMEHPLTAYIAMDQSQKQALNDTESGPHNYQNFSLQEFRLPEAHQQRHSDPIVSPANEEIRNHGKVTSVEILREDKVQIELAEIINDFKNNVHTIAQTERLVAEWQNRNDVQKSFQEKQEQLREMRMRYEQIQRDMKHGSSGGSNGSERKSSPFERFKRIFGWNHQQSQQAHRNNRAMHHHQRAKSTKEEDAKLLCGSASVMLMNGCSGSADARPISSLSLQSTASSASSGTISIASGCSLGDSGTHSDVEERKLTAIEQHRLHLHQHGSASAFQNYLIPPTPRPVLLKTFAPTEEMLLMRNKQQQHHPPMRVDPFYIQFPPNGLPVNGGSSMLLEDEVDTGSNQLFTIQEQRLNDGDEAKCDGNDNDKKHRQQQQEYMNLSAASAACTLIQIHHQPQQHDYMNFKTAT